MRVFGALFRREVSNDRCIYAGITVYLVVANAVLVPAGYVFPGLFFDYLVSFAWLDLAEIPGLLLVILAIRGVCRHWDRRYAWFVGCFDRARLARFLAGQVLVLAFVPFMATFTTMKSYIGARGFAADTFLANVDRDLHFGVDPVVWLHQEVNYEAIWPFLGFLYGPGWLLWTSGFVFWMAAVCRSPETRIRFFLNYIFAWAILGNLVAWVAISAGPAFFAEVTGDHQRFAAVMQTINAFRLWDGVGIGDLQRYLWDLYASRTEGVGMGISAFPSLHVAMMTLCALFALERSWLVGALAGVAAIATLFGSVLFAWHYAIDGYFSIAAMTGLWLLSRHLAFDHSRLLRRSPSTIALPGAMTASASSKITTPQPELPVAHDAGERRRDHGRTDRRRAGESRMSSWFSRSF